MKKLLQLFVVGLLIFGVSGVSTAYAAVTGVTLNKAETTIVKGEVERLTATLTTSGFSYNRDVTWSSSNPAVASVEAVQPGFTQTRSGDVTAVAPGTATITVTTVQGNHTASCVVEVSIAVDGITATRSVINIAKGDTDNLADYLDFDPADATNKNVKWSVIANSNETTDVVKFAEDGFVDHGNMKANALGSASVVATTEDGEFTANFLVIVRTPVDVTGVKLDKSKAALVKVADGFTQELLTLVASVEPTTADFDQVKWSSDTTSVATVSDEGVVTPLKAGTAIITVKTVDGGFTDKCEVTITDQIRVTGVELNKSTTTVLTGKTETLTASVLPADKPIVKDVEWSSNNEAVATVSDSGAVKAIAPGVAIIKVKTVDGNFEDVCTVSVRDAFAVTKVSIDETMALGTKETKTLKATVLPAFADDKDIVWSSTDSTVAAVSKTGEVTGVTPGVATITAKSVSNPEVSDECVVTVTATPVTDVKLNKSKITLIESETETLTASVAPVTAFNKDVVWTSSDATVATVSNDGLVTALTSGTATITVKTVDGNKTDTCVVTVDPLISVTGIKLNKSSITVLTGETETLEATVLPADAYNKDFKWSVAFTASETTVVTVSDKGVVTAVAPGIAHIRVTTVDGNKMDLCTVTVRDAIAVTGVELNKSELALSEGDTETLEATVLPVDADNKDLLWSSDATSVATVSDEGVVTAVKAGTATITVTTVDGNKTATCEVTVSEVVVPVEGIELNQTKVTLSVGQSIETPLKATVLPAGATDQVVFWRSSNAKVAGINPKTGNVKAWSKGTATITATTRDGRKTAEFVVTVGNPVPVTGIKLSQSRVTLGVGKSLRTPLKATVLPAGATDQVVFWRSSNAKVAGINPKTGNVKGWSKGTANITATTRDGRFVATFKVTVR